MEQVVRRVSARMFSVFVSLCLALAFVPITALADNAVSGTIVLNYESIEVESGGTVSLDGCAEVVNLDPDDGDYHFDYVADFTEDEVEFFTVSKHAGIVTASTVTENSTATVTVYLLAGDAVSGTSGKPCDGYDILDTATVTVTVTADETVEYGYQGDGFSILLDSPAVEKAVVDGTTYTNTVTAQTAGKRVEFTYCQSAGLSQYLNYYETWEFDSPEDAYQALAGQYISYRDGAGNVTTVAASSAVEVTKVTSTTVTICVPVGTSTGSGTLSFDEELHTFKQDNKDTVNKELGVNIDFIFAIE